MPQTKKNLFCEANSRVFTVDFRHRLSSNSSTINSFLGYLVLFHSLLKDKQTGTITTPKN